jgi:hypothetical protein
MLTDRQGKENDKRIYILVEQGYSHICCSNNDYKHVNLQASLLFLLLGLSVFKGIETTQGNFRKYQLILGFVEYLV